jgi:hypothetical protein
MTPVTQAETLYLLFRIERNAVKALHSSQADESTRTLASDAITVVRMYKELLAQIKERENEGG